MDGYNIYKRDPEWGNKDKRKNGGVAIFVRDHLKVLSVKRNEAFEIISVELLLYCLPGIICLWSVSTIHQVLTIVNVI